MARCFPYPLHRNMSNPRSNESTMRFTLGNFYEDRESDLRTIPRSFKVHCKTTECYGRLNLPPIAKEIFGTKEKMVDIECGYGGWVFGCVYQFHQAKAGKREVSRLCMGWNKVVDVMGISQGDWLYFEQDWEDPGKFHVSIDKHDGAITVECVGWI